MLTATHKLEFKSGKRTAKTIVEARAQSEKPTPVRIPRITKMMALAIRFDHLIKTDEITDQAELARLGARKPGKADADHELAESRADIQEEVLHMELHGSEGEIKERDLRKVVRFADWGKPEEDLGTDKEIRKMRFLRFSHCFVIRGTTGFLQNRQRCVERPKRFHTPL